MVVPHSAMLSKPPTRGRKHISFNSNKNRVRFVRVPPRTQNPKYWFTEKQHVVKKGMHFELDPDFMVSLNISGRLQLTVLSREREVEVVRPPAIAAATAAGAVASQRHNRSFVDVMENSSLFCTTATGADRWHCIGSVAVGEMAKVRVVVPPGSYRFRTRGGGRVQLFAQVWDIERELV